MIPVSFHTSLVFFAVFLITILVGLRQLKTMSPALFVCGSAVLVYLAALFLANFRPWQIHFFSFSALYWFLTLSLLMFFGAVYKSISLRIMLHLLNQRDKADGYDAILENYIKNQSYLQRVTILLEKKMLEEPQPGEFRLTSKGRLVARRLAWIQTVFAIKDSG